MSTIVIVSICAAIATVIGLRVYFEHKEEKDFENSTKEDVFSDLQSFVIDQQESKVTSIVVEEKLENEPASSAPNISFTDVEPVNSAVAEAEVKPKKKRRYYGKPKAKKQTKNKS